MAPARTMDRTRTGPVLDRGGSDPARPECGSPPGQRPGGRWADTARCREGPVAVALSRDALHRDRPGVPELAPGLDLGCEPDHAGQRRGRGPRLDRGGHVRAGVARLRARSRLLEPDPAHVLLDGRPVDVGADHGRAPADRGLERLGLAALSWDHEARGPGTNVSAGPGMRPGPLA